MDRAGAEFTLVLSNLDTQGHVNFDLLRTSTGVDNGVDGSALHSSDALNEVNELRPGETYAVACDRHTKRTLGECARQRARPSARAHTVMEDTSVSVANDEMAVDVARGGTGDVLSSATRGSYLYLSVAPERDAAAQCARFAAGTRWQVADEVFVRVTPPLPGRSQPMWRDAAAATTTWSQVARQQPPPPQLTFTFGGSQDVTLSPQQIRAYESELCLARAAPLGACVRAQRTHAH